VVLGNLGEQELTVTLQDRKQLRENGSSHALIIVELAMATTGPATKAASAQTILLSLMWLQVETSFSCGFSQHSQQS